MAQLGTGGVPRGSDSTLNTVGPVSRNFRGHEIPTGEAGIALKVLAVAVSVNMCHELDCVYSGNWGLSISPHAIWGTLCGRLIPETTFI